MPKSPYLKNSNRLEDVIAAIQVLGAYEKRTSRKLKFWISLLGNDEKHWEKVFRDHPEFFRVNDRSQHNEVIDEDDANENREIWVSLRWRVAYLGIYDYNKNRELTEDELSNLSDEQKKKLTRKPLSSEQIQSLIATAIELNEKAISDDSRRKWWKPLLTGVFVIFGALIGLLSSQLTNHKTEEIWQNEKNYLQLDKMVDKRIEVYENMIKVINSSNEAKLMWTKIEVIRYLDSVKTDYYQQYPLAILESSADFELNNNNREQIEAITRLNDLSKEFAFTVSMAKTFFGARSNEAIDKLSVQPWWENDSLHMANVINSMSGELYDFE